MDKLTYIKEKLKRMTCYQDAASMISFDQSTVCPEGAMDEKNEMIAILEEQALLIRKEEEFQNNVRLLYKKKDQLPEWDRFLIEQLYRRDLMEQNITPEKMFAFSMTEKRAFLEWCDAKAASDFSLFLPSLSAVIKNNKEKSALRVLLPEEEEKMKTSYDRLLDVYERGMTEELLDPLFEETKERLGALLSGIKNSKKRIRTDFLGRSVPAEKQRAVTELLMTLQGFDLSRGTYSESEHAYTERLSDNDIRITTHIYPENFLSNIYTTLHETGHALFDQRQPKENNEHYLTEGKTFGMHESVSRFYENILGRSESFIAFLFPKLKELLPETLFDVSEREFFEAANLVTPSLIRTEADEVTYGFHIIIRYELEKALFNGGLKAEELSSAWNELYEKYLGIRPDQDRNGVLQDVHWTSDFGYFPAYLLGNFYNAMYFRCMQEEFDVSSDMEKGSFERVNAWMEARVFQKADRLTPAEWIKDITGRALTADDFLTYLEKKYKNIYEL